MNHKLVCLALTTALLGACNRSETPAQPSPKPSADVTAPVDADSATPLGNAILINGYVPNFPHKVRSMRNEGSSHVVVLEYFEVDRDAVIAAMADSMRSQGFKISGPQPRDAAVQYVYVGGNGRMGAIFSDPSSVPLMNRAARGVAMFSWTDAAAN